MNSGEYDKKSFRWINRVASAGGGLRFPPGGFSVKRILIISTVLCLSTATAGRAITGASFGLKGGIGTSVDLAGVRIPGAGISQMKAVGVQARLTSLPLVDLVFSADYFWKKIDIDLSGFVTLPLPPEAQYKISDLALTASIVYRFDKRLLKPYLGGGLATHILTYDFDEYIASRVPGLEVPRDQNRVGYHIILGVDLNVPAFPLCLFGEFRANWIETDTGTSDFNSLMAGIYYKTP
jgi:hypothetical protein